MSSNDVYCTLRNLNQKEKDTLILLVEGYSNAEIAKILDVKTNTVEYRLKKIYSLFDVNNKRDLMLLFVDDFVLKILKSPVLD